MKETSDQQCDERNGRLESALNQTPEFIESHGRSVYKISTQLASYRYLVNTEHYTENTPQIYTENIGGAYIRALSILIDRTCLETKKVC